jgi:hypothetical protein
LIEADVLPHLFEALSLRIDRLDESLKMAVMTESIVAFAVDEYMRRDRSHKGTAHKPLNTAYTHYMHLNGSIDVNQYPPKVESI